MIIVKCAWCGYIMDCYSNGKIDGVSHGICADCYEKQRKELEKLKQSIREGNS